jgi:hypothetical protein
MIWRITAYFSNPSFSKNASTASCHVRNVTPINLPAIFSNGVYSGGKDARAHS